MSRFLDALRSGRVLLMDGAMGTELQRAGLKPGECGELWNVTHPDKVRAIHQAYVDAGAEVLVTNTFQANPAALARHNLDDQLGMIFQAGVENARHAAGPDRWVLADVGPFPLGNTDLGARLVTAIAAAGPNAILLETCNGPAEALDLLGGYLAIGPSAPPLLLSLAFRRDRDRRIIIAGATSPRNVAELTMKFLPIAALGVNCGRDMGMPQIAEVVETYREVVAQPVFARPNAGTPNRVKDRWLYPQSPEYMASWLPELLEAGVSMVGGCCGTTPAHIAAFRPIIEEWNRRACPTSR